MAVIDNPRHSRPIDVHRWSDHPEVKALVEGLWDGYLPEEITGKLAGEKPRPGPKPKTSRGCGRKVAGNPTCATIQLIEKHKMRLIYKTRHRPTIALNSKHLLRAEAACNQ